MFKRTIKCSVLASEKNVYGKICYHIPTDSCGVLLWWYCIRAILPHSRPTSEWAKLGGKCEMLNTSQVCLHIVKIEPAHFFLCGA